ncbi:MAG TPA: pyridoxal-phosphate dependent enzyme, partial [Anaerolineaceae bacterium]|nr:pyridoxal-phosphate dependent enzyme [Anaerolineaceae bacterium]
RQPYPEHGLPYICPACGGIYDFDAPPDFDPKKVEPGLPGYWRYRHAFSLPVGAPLVSLGEGNTPLIWADAGSEKVALKLESLNPTGSYKDRGSAVLVSRLAADGAQRAVEDSSGNAGASFAAYMARANLAARVYVPESASGPKREQIEAYGAELRPIPGPRSAAAQAVLAEAQQGVPYGSHAYLPFGLAGIATIAYELIEQLGCVPGTVVAPVGHGGLLLGILRGFAAALRIEHPPYYVGVQAAACAPLVHAWQNGLATIEQVTEGATLAEGVRVRRPLRAEALLAEIPRGKGEFLAVPEEELLPAFRALAHGGVYVEPTSALVWAAMRQLGKVPRPLVLIISGIGLKYRSEA